MNKTVVVGMSGGVDSSVTALLLKKEGYKVIGLFMKNWEEKDSNGQCMSLRDFEDVSSVCREIDIPYYSVNFVTEYREAVFSDFLASCRAGLTPNPDVLCNKEIKFKVFLKKALELGADYLATGHYCQIAKEKNGVSLLKGHDPDKDQSYFLHAVEQTALQKTLFFFFHLLKKDVRAIAKQFGLSTSKKKDSTGICFIGERNFKPFLSQFLGFQRGPFLSLEEKVVGYHDGIAYYTVGQRKGMALGGEGDAWYVVKKDLSRNAVFVVRGKDHPALYASELFAKQLTWIYETPCFPFRCSAKIRYRQQDTACELVYLEPDLIKVMFAEPQRAITPGQSVVFYRGDVCLGGGIII